MTKKKAKAPFLTLGTAQLGFDYGVANKSGVPAEKEALRILDEAWKCGIRSFDTASDYGRSERIIGVFIRERAVSKEIIVASKLPRVKAPTGSSEEKIYKIVKNHMERSLKVLGLDKMPLYLMHNAADMTSYGGKVFRSLIRLKEEGLIGTVGVSIYHPSEAITALKKKDIDVVQLPINLFDQRFVRKSLVKKLCDSGKSVFARSVFLQGLFFLEEKEVPKKLFPAVKYLRKLREMSLAEKMAIDDIAMRFVLSVPGVASVIVGAESVAQVKRNAAMGGKVLSRKIGKKITVCFKNVPRKIMLPYMW
ncbi:MAG TPA: aldo/keto reductase [Candidatus Omnitrophota bacterium]|nr:aldo/keto reductase [Candidatus Omnitrophota bacterium]HPS19529.1 aldo/keto reductase [Candidatus Omnitrophota bacterium]